MISVTGIKELDRALKSLPRELSHKVLGAAHLAAAKPLIQREKQLAPFREGDLSESIGGVKTSMQKADSLGEVRVGPRRTRQHRGHHAHLVEKGTKRRHNKKGANRGVMPAQPFVQPAFEQTSGPVERNIAVELSSVVVRTLQRNVKK